MKARSQNLSKIIIIALVALIFGGVFAYKTSNQKSDRNVTEGGKQLLAQAREEGKPVYILFHSRTCAPCQEMETIVKQVMPPFKEKIVYVDVNVYDKAQQELVAAYGIRSIPTSYFLGKDGGVRYSHVGVISEADLKGLLDKLEEGNL